MSSYYDDDDFREEYLRRDEEALDWAIEERERDAAQRRDPGV